MKCMSARSTRQVTSVCTEWRRRESWTLSNAPFLLVFDTQMPRFQIFG
jgi:hypothetical protein